MTKTMNEKSISRRSVIKGLSAVAGGAVAGGATALSWMPFTVQAQTGGIDVTLFTNPPIFGPVEKGGTLGKDYLAALKSVTDGAFSSMPDQLYALSALTRTGMTINNASSSYTATAFVDGTVSDNSRRPVTGPTMEFIRGSSNGVWFQNNMTVCGTANNMSMSNPESRFNPHGYSTTNLHTHGLHVSPKPPADDVLIMVQSSLDPSAMAHGGHGGHGDGADVMTTFPYFYDVPDDHPVGTFWYHPHKHGSVASQVGSGMAGALLIRKKPGETDFDDLIAAAPYNIGPEDERIAVLQQMNFYNDKTNGTDVFFQDGYYTGKSPVKITDPSCYGMNPTELSYPGSQKTAVNGAVVPNMVMQEGQIIRLRMVNATNGQTYVPKIDVVLGVEQALPKVYAIATDGIALPVPYGYTPVSDVYEPYFHIDYGLKDKKQSEPVAYWTTAEILTLAPGQRVDLLIQAQGIGVFMLKGAADGEAPSMVEHDGPNTDNLIRIEVLPSTPGQKKQQIPPMSLYADSRITRPDIPDWAPLRTNTQPTTVPKPTRPMTFKTVDANFAKGEAAFLINDTYFDGSVDAQVELKLNATDFWTVNSTNEGHIFHIHINSFVAFARTPYDTQTKAYASPVFYSIPIWRDTIYFDAISGDDQEPGTSVSFTSMQVEFTGEFVLHCHNLFHEDSGMMLTVSIEP